MAEKLQVHPELAQSDHPMAKHDAEAAVARPEDELRRQKRLKWLLCIVVFVIFQIGVIVLFSMTVMKFRTPKFRLREATFDAFKVQTSNASFNLRMNSELGVKNTNFGPYKFNNTTIFFYYNGSQVGSAAIRKSKANFRSIKKLDVAVDLVAPASLAGNSELERELSSGILPLTSTSKLNGKVTVMFMFKKKKSAQMNCNMEVNTVTKQLQNVKCR